MPLLMLLALLAACGKKGPVRPLRQPLPAAAPGLEARQLGDRVLLSWGVPRLNQDGSPVKDLEGFRILRMRYDLTQDCPECRDTSTLLREVDLDYLREVRRVGDRLYLWDDNLETGFGYQYRVVPFTSRGREGEAAQLRLPFVPPLPAPAALSAASHDRLVRLSWQPPAEKRGGVEMLGYNLYRRSDSDPFPELPLNREVVAATAFDDFGVENGQTYVYAVRAVARILGHTVESPLSATAAATPEEGR
jgi:hypothetical protein